jgi:hypothetical protein
MYICLINCVLWHNINGIHIEQILMKFYNTNSHYKRNSKFYFDQTLIKTATLLKGPSMFWGNVIDFNEINITYCNI